MKDNFGNFGTYLCGGKEIWRKRMVTNLAAKSRVSMEKNVSFCLVCAECIGPSPIKNILIPQHKKMLQRQNLNLNLTLLQVDLTVSNLCD